MEQIVFELRKISKRNRVFKQGGLFTWNEKCFAARWLYEIGRMPAQPAHPAVFWARPRGPSRLVAGSGPAHQGPRTRAGGQLELEPRTRAGSCSSSD